MRSASSRCRCQSASLVRADLFALIRATPGLDWLLLTKRIGNAGAMTEAAGGWPPNVWLGATIVNQTEADRDVPKLLATAGPRVRFLSMEPLLGPVDLTCLALSGDYEMDALTPYLWEDEVQSWAESGEANWVEQFEDERGRSPHGLSGPMHPTLDWIIVGGESGPGARPMHPDWARSLRDQCAAAGVPFLFKQGGSIVSRSTGSGTTRTGAIATVSAAAQASGSIWPVARASMANGFISPSVSARKPPAACSTA